MESNLISWQKHSNAAAFTNFNKTNQRITSLKRLLDSWLLIQTSREYHVMIRRIDYVVATWRLIDAIGQVLQLGNKKELAAVRTVCSHITNLCKGVTKVRLRFNQNFGKGQK